MSADTLERMPALYLSHGAPPLADDPIWPGELAAWSADLPRPKAILMVSAHWEEAPSPSARYGPSRSSTTSGASPSTTTR